jgi:intein/homing endonuclease
LVVNQTAIDRGLFRADSIKKFHSEIVKNPSTSQDDIFTKPDPNKVTGLKQGNYSKLNDQGFAPEETMISNNDIIIGKVSPIQPTGNNNKVYKDSSEQFKSNVDGVIDRVHTGIYNAEGYEMYNVRVRMERKPIIGDKFSNRHGQKGTLGIPLPQKDMPFTESGIIPDMIMNPHCFVGETLVSLPNGTSKRIDGFINDGSEKVLSFSKDYNGIKPSYSLGTMYSGNKDTIKITLIDGRELICTPDHRFRVSVNNKNIWKQAKDLEYDDKLIMGPIGTEDINYGDESEWSLKMGDYEFNYNDIPNREKTLAFARLLGYILTDGTICKLNDNKNNYVSRLSMGSMFDAESILDDIELITDKRPKISDVYSKHTNASTYCIALPDKFSKSLAKLEGICIGRRTCQESSYPTFIKNCPLSFIREFLGGLFGGDGWAPHFHKSSKNTFSEVRFSQSTNKEHEASLESTINYIIELMIKLQVNAEIYRKRDYVTGDNNMISIEIKVKSNNTFRKYIGFRHCIQKLLRLEVASTYENYCDQVKLQHNNMMEKVNTYLGVTNNIDNFKGSPINKALEKARNELYKDCKVLNEYYSLLTPTLVQNRRKKDRSSNCNVFDYKYMVNAKTFIEMCNCNLWFEKNSYINERESMVLPNYNLTIMKKELNTNRDVYDIGVRWFHSFFAEGVNVHNCIPSRMTAGQLVETLSSKEAALNGHFVDGTPFSDYNIREIPQILKKLGYSEHGTETMYNGMTGKKIEAQIFIGPTYQVRLKHMVQDKVHGRARGPRQALTRQPLEGRSRDGGLKIGKYLPKSLYANIRLVCIVAGNIP